LWTIDLLAAGVLVILVYDSMCAAGWHEGMLLSNNEKLPKANMGFVLMLSSPPCVPPPAVHL